MGHEPSQILVVHLSQVALSEKIEELLHVREVAAFGVGGDVFFVLQIAEEIEEVLAHKLL